MGTKTIARLLIVLFFLTLIFSIIVIAKSHADVELTTTINTYNDDYLSASNGFKLNLISDNGFYLSGEYSGFSELKYGGQYTADVFFYSLSAGLRSYFDFDRAKGFVYVQAGWYMPDFNMLSDYEEAFGYRHHELLHGTKWQHWENYSYDLKPGIGGEFGLGIQKNLMQTLSVSMFGAYRVLKLREIIEGWGPEPKSTGFWETHNDKDFGGYLFGLTLTKEF